MAKERAIFDFSNAGVKRMAKKLIDAQVGLCWWELTKAKDAKTLSQLAYVFGVCYPRIAAGMEEAWGESRSVMQTHEFCKDRFLKEPVVNRNTGQEMGHTEPSLADLDVQQMSEYIENLILFAATYLSIEIPIALRSAARCA